NVGFMPTTPTQTAGMRLDPPSSVPSAAKAMPAATATADPALEPPGVRVPVGSYGLRTWPVWLVVATPRAGETFGEGSPETDGAGGETVRRGLAEHDRAGGAQARHLHRIVPHRLRKEPCPLRVRGGGRQ